MTACDADGHMVQVLKDGREMVIALATEADVPEIAREHPLPRGRELSEPAMRSYYALKTHLYVTTQGSGIMTGRVGGCLAGFVCLCGDTAVLRRHARSFRTIGWIAGQVLRRRFGGPREWWSWIRWGCQHFRRPKTDEQVGSDGCNAGAADVTAEIGTVHTVEAFRRLGVADALLAAAESALAGQGRSEVALWVASDNVPALSLYEQRGYRRSIEVQRIGERCWLMTKQLQPDPTR